MTLLYIDTESNPDTKKPECITYKYGKEAGIIEIFDKISFAFLSRLWKEAEAVMMFNAPYDLGVLSICYPENSYKWIKKEESGVWEIIIFNHKYHVRKLGLHTNIIRRFNKTPVIDLLKLWYLLVDDGRKNPIGLKALIQRELEREPIHWRPESALTDAYRYQDVYALEELFIKFFEKIKDIEFLKDYSYADWSDIKTVASFCKLEYKKHYPGLRAYQRENDKQDEKYNLLGALESAYHGGITLAFYRGYIYNTAWIDIKSAYASVITHLNTDQYLKYKWQSVKNVRALDTSLERPVLCYIQANFVLRNIDKSFKLFGVKSLAKYWIWGYDIEALKLLYPAFKYKILEGYRLIPLLKSKESLPAVWNIMKQDEEKKNGKTTRREFLKFLSNTSYGIKAQRKPFRTIHTNLAISGLITARARLILAEIIAECQNNGYIHLYSDTDSVCVTYKKFNKKIISLINTRIYPYIVECEGYDFFSIILSLKRYISIKGKLISGEKATDKIRLHGKGRYNIYESDIYDYVINRKIVNKHLIIKQMSANTALSMTEITNRAPEIIPYIHPFCFIKDVECDTRIEKYLKAWYLHIDTKTTLSEDLNSNIDFTRKYHVFKDIKDAIIFFNKHKTNNSLENSLYPGRYVDWDKEIQMFK